MNPSSGNILVHLRPLEGAARRKGAVGTRRLPSSASEASPRRLRVGVWDLGAWLGSLPELLERFNGIQDCYHFFAVEATVPVGIIRRGDGVVRWLRESGKKLSAEESKIAGTSLVADDYYTLADPVCRELQLDWLVGITPSMIADRSGGEIEWDYFSSFRRRLVLASAADLRRFSKETKLPFDRFLGVLIVGQLLVAQFHGSRHLGFHDNRHCLFDYNEDRETIKESVGQLTLESGCRALIGPKFRSAASALVDFLIQLQ